MTDNQLIEHLKRVISEKMHCQDREDRSLDWNLGFLDGCQFVMDAIHVLEDAPTSGELIGPTP